MPRPTKDLANLRPWEKAELLIRALELVEIRMNALSEDPETDRYPETMARLADQWADTLPDIRRLKGELKTARAVISTA